MGSKRVRNSKRSCLLKWRIKNTFGTAHRNMAEENTIENFSRLRVFFCHCPRLGVMLNVTAAGIIIAIFNSTISLDWKNYFCEHKTKRSNRWQNVLEIILIHNAVITTINWRKNSWKSSLNLYHNLIRLRAQHVFSGRLGQNTNQSLRRVQYTNDPRSEVLLMIDVRHWRRDAIVVTFLPLALYARRCVDECDVIIIKIR